MRLSGPSVVGLLLDLLKFAAEDKKHETPSLVLERTLAIRPATGQACLNLLRWKMAAPACRTTRRLLSVNQSLTVTNFVRLVANLPVSNLQKFYISCFWTIKTHEYWINQRII